jgi:hypothetical protein
VSCFSIDHSVKGTSKNYVFRGGGVGRSPTYSPFAFRRKAKGEVFRDALKRKYTTLEVYTGFGMGSLEKQVFQIRSPLLASEF